MSLKEGQRYVNGTIVDSNIPVLQDPPFKRKHPLPLLNVGDSFFLPGTKANNFHNVTKYWSDKLGTQYTMRTVTEEGVKGIRVWRVK